MVFGLVGLSQIADAAVRVNGYYRSNGTYVQPHYRSSPDSSPYNNYSYPGNTNPYTGVTAGGNPDTYLNNYYGSSGTYSAPTYSRYNYSYPTIPTCPLNSYYDGVASCKCNYGYLVKGGSCVSADSVCWDQTGYSSSYDSLSNTCKCNLGYVLDTLGKCTSANLVCSNQIGLMSQYNSLSNKCECMIGYEFNGSSCVYKTNNYNYTSTYPFTQPGINPSNNAGCTAGARFSVTTGAACTTTVTIAELQESLKRLKARLDALKK